MFVILESPDGTSNDTKWSWKTVDEKIEFSIEHDTKEITKDYRFCLSGEVTQWAKSPQKQSVGVYF